MSSRNSLPTALRIRGGLFSGLIVSICIPVFVQADHRPPLHQEINQHVARELGSADVGKAEDSQFLRRLTLDLTGMVPTATSVRRFCESTAADKRVVEVNRLLDSREHQRHLERVIDGWLMRRRPNRNVTANEWKSYLRQAVSSNRHWDQLTTEILSSDGRDPGTRGAARFYLDRECNTDDLVRDIGSIFLGRDIRCAQCHDHPIVPDFKQADYFGIAAFVDRTFLLEDKGKQLKVVAEKSDGVTAFTSALTQVSGVTAPRIFRGPQFPDPTPNVNSIADALTPEGSLPISTYSRRALLPAAIVNHSAFGRTLANRLWSLVFGRGIVEPIDQDHESNSPADPELLDLLSARIVEMNYDLRAFLRELVLTDLYTHSSGEPTHRSGEAKAFHISKLLRKLSPEQLTWSWLRASGQWDAELTQLLSEPVSAETAIAAAIDSDVSNLDEIVYGRLLPEAEKVIRIFTTSLPGESERSDTTPGQALFLLNGETLQKWIAVRPGNVLDRLLKLENDDQTIDELYFSVVSRRADPHEQVWIRELLKGSQESRESVLADLIEALLTSTEFRFNH